VDAPGLVRDEAAVLGEQRAGLLERRERAALDDRAGAAPPAAGASPRGTAAPRSTASTAISSATDRASGPMLSSDGASGRSPVRSIRAAEGLKPAIPQNAAGTRIEPAVSVPIATGTTPAATATAEPDDEPPGTRSGASGFGGVPKCGLSPSPEYASSLRLVFPTHTIPAAARRATTGASATAGAASRYRIEPHVVGAPATSIRSFHATRTPSSGPSGVPAS
jgi:hypothetical protein